MAVQLNYEYSRSRDVYNVKSYSFDKTSVYPLSGISNMKLTCVSCLSAGIIYYTVLGHGSTFGAIKRAYMPNFESGSNNPVVEVDLGLRYIMQPDGLAVDWVGR